MLQKKSLKNKKINTDLKLFYYTFDIIQQNIRFNLDFL